MRAAHSLIQTHSRVHAKHLLLDCRIPGGHGVAIQTPAHKAGEEEGERRRHGAGGVVTCDRTVPPWGKGTKGVRPPADPFSSLFCPSCRTWSSWQVSRSSWPTSAGCEAGPPFAARRPRGPSARAPACTRGEAESGRGREGEIGELFLVSCSCALGVWGGSQSSRRREILTAASSTRARVGHRRPTVKVIHFVPSHPLWRT